MQKHLLEIQELVERYQHGFQQRDIKLIASTLSEDFIAITPDKPPIIGKDNACHVIAEVLAQVDQIESARFILSEVKLFTDWGYAWGVSKLRYLMPGDNSANQVDGKFMWILVKSTQNQWQFKQNCSLVDF